jgi:hypothetical protein
VGAAAVIASLVGATGAQAAPAFHCEASALRATVAGTQTVEPVTRGRGADCTTGSATPSLALPPLLSAQALFADTTFDAASPSGSATGGIAHLAVLPSPELIAQAQAPIVAAIDALPPITLPNVPGVPFTNVTVDVGAALRALIPPVPSSLVSVDLLNAQANVGCGGGAPVFSGASQVAGVKLLGQDIGLDSVLDQTLPLINAQSIALSQLDFTKVKVYDPTGLTQITAPLVLAAVKPALAALPPITLPASFITVQLIPNEQVRGGDFLIQRALHAAITLAGQPVLDAVLGEAKVSADAGMCAPPTVPPARTAAPAKAAGSAVAQGSVADQLLACSDRKLVLVDVLKQGSRVKLLGAANRSYVGKRVAIRLRATGRVVAHATVRKDGSFQTTAAMPPRAYLATHEKANSVRYRAEIGKELSLPLKLQRRLIVNSLTSKDGKVTIAGRVVRPLTTPVSTIRIVRRVSCHKVVLVKRFKPNADGTFRVTVKAPKGQAAAIYRLATSVREKASNPRSYPTFTLPRGVALNTR